MIGNFREAVENRHEYARELKNKGSRIIGWMCSYVPEELIHAAGFVPIRVIGGKENTSMADAHLYINMCSLVRSALEEGMRGKYSYLEGFIALNTCDNIRRLYDVWTHYLPPPFFYILSMPHKVSPEAITFFRSQLEDLKAKLEELRGDKITKEDLEKSIKLYNRARKLQKELSDTTRNGAGSLKGSEIFTVNLASGFLAKEKYVATLENLLQKVKSRKPLQNDDRTRLLVLGSELDNPDLFQLIESCGGNVVAEDLCTGSKTFWNLVEETCDPLEALAKAYLLRPPCPRMRMSEERLEHLKGIIKEFAVQGVVHESIKFCKLYEEDCITISIEMKSLGVPFLSLSREYTLSSQGQFKTRLEAFIESLSV